jgi:hypothetical protein
MVRLGWLATVLIYKQNAKGPLIFPLFCIVILFTKTTKFTVGVFLKDWEDLTA